MAIDTWLLFFTAYLITTLSPGPNVILVLKNSVRYGWRSALITIFGNLSCQLIIVCLVALGVAELLKQLPAWFIAIKCVGGLYLIYLGIKSLRSLRASNIALQPDKAPREHKSAHHTYIKAFLVSASNPKTMIFLSAFLPQFIDVSHSYSGQFTIMFATICFIVTLVHLAYAQLISKLGKAMVATNFEQKLAKITGGLFITMGGGVLLSSNP